jgi:hypothetical protein
MECGVPITDGLCQACWKAAYVEMSTPAQATGGPHPPMPPEYKTPASGAVRLFLMEEKGIWHAVSPVRVEIFIPYGKIWVPVICHRVRPDGTIYEHWDGKKWIKEKG